MEMLNSEDVEMVGGGSSYGNGFSIGDAVGYGVGKGVIMCGAVGTVALIAIGAMLLAD